MYDYSSKSAYLRSEQLSEGYATISNITAQREIADNGGPKIPLSVSRENIPTYNAIYDEINTTDDMRGAAIRMGQVYGDGEKSIDPSTGAVRTYNQIFGDHYDARYKNGH